MSRRTIFVTMVLGALLLPALSYGQEQGGQNQDRGGDRGGDRGPGSGRGNWDPAQARERMATWMKEQMGVNDEEFKVIQPKLEKVVELSRDARGGGFFGRRGGDRSPDDQQRSAAQTAAKELRETLDNKNATAEQIAAKLKALREAREKAKTDLAAAQKDLKDLLTQRQEATLVMMGMLD